MKLIIAEKPSLARNIIAGIDGKMDKRDGFYIGRYTLDSEYMSEIIDAAFTLKAGEHSGVIENYYGVYIVYAMEKDAKYLENDSNYERIAELYVSNEFYKSLEKCKNKLAENVQFTDFFNSLNFAEIEY